MKNNADAYYYMLSCLENKYERITKYIIHYNIYKWGENCNL